MVLISGATVLLLGWFHADLWFGQGGGDVSSWRLGLMALLSDGAKVTLFTAGVWLVINAARGLVRFLGVFAIAVSLALVVLSVAGVFGGLSVSEAKMTGSALPDPVRSAELIELAKSYTDQKVSLEESKKLLPNDWYTARAEIDKQIATAQAGLQKIADLKRSIPTKPPAETAYFLGVASVLGWSVDRTRVTIYGAYAILLELVSLLSTLLAFLGVNLASVGTARPPEAAKKSPLVQSSAPAEELNPIPGMELARFARIRQTMDKYLSAAYVEIEAGQGDYFLGRNKIIALSGLDRGSVDWCQKQLVNKRLATITQDPQRTFPVGPRKELMTRLFGAPVHPVSGDR